MAGFPDTFAGSMLDAVTGRGVSSVYVALVIADPGVDPTLSSISEVLTAGYARVAVSFTAPAGSPPETHNTALLTFGPFTADMASPVTHALLVTASTGTSGAVRWVWALDESLQALNTQTIQLPIGSLSLAP